MEDFKGAIADYDQALSIDPENPMAFSNRGFVKKNLGDLKGALDDLDKAIGINPIFGDAYKNRGFLKLHLGDRRGACSDFKKDISLGSQSGAQWLQSSEGEWCRNMP